MIDIGTEIIRMVILGMIFFGLIVGGRRQKAIAQPGWGLLLGGFGLLMFACVLDVTDNFESLNRFVVIGNTPAEAILEKLVGFLGGFVLIGLGLLRWLPCLTSMSELQLVAVNLERANRQLEITATTDSLTGLPNRAVFLNRLELILARSRRDNSRFAVCFIDFDRFKVINDSLGHKAGDTLLCLIADILCSEVREVDTVARLGGDEFVVLLSDLKSWSDAEEVTARLLDRLARPHQIGTHHVVTTASIGVVTSERVYESPIEIIRDADAAMYQAKESGKARVVVFDQQMHRSAVQRLSLEADLRKAAASCEQFRLVYQPIVELDSGRLKGFEALLRWDHPDHGLIQPIDFITIAEDTGMIIHIGHWVMRTAANQVSDWNRRLCGERKLCMNVNVSKCQLLHPDFLKQALACREMFGLSPEDLHLEITESSVADSRNDLTATLRKLRGHGFPIAMDDFGTGMSSLSSLHGFPIDVLKIDQAFIRVLDRDRSLLAVVTSITSLAENLGIKTVAEGIESEDIVAALQSINCTWGQGYYFAKPMAPGDAEAYILKDRHRHTHAA